MRATVSTAFSTLVLGALAATSSLGCESTASDCAKLGTCTGGGGGTGGTGGAGGTTTTTTTTTDTESAGGGGAGGTGTTTTTAPCPQESVVHYGATLDQSAFRVFVSSSTDIAIAGSFSGSLKFGMAEIAAADPGPSVFVARAGSSLSANVATKLEGKYLASALHPTGGLVVVGVHSASVILGCPTALDVPAGYPLGLFVVGLDPSGACLFQRSFGTTQVDRASVAVAPTGDIVIAGGFVGQIQLGDAPALPESSAGGADVFVAKLGPEGAHDWSDSYGDANDDQARAVAIFADPMSADTKVIVAGDHDGGLDFANGAGALESEGGPAGFLVVFESGGGVHWARSFQVSAGQQRLSDVAVDATDPAAPVVVLAGDLLAGDVTKLVPSVLGDKPPDLKTTDHALFLARFALNKGGSVNAGAHLASRAFQGLGDMAITGMALDPEGRVLLGGWLDTSLDFDMGPGGELAASDAPGAFMAVLDQSLTHRKSLAFSGKGEESRVLGVAFDGGDALVAGHFAGELGLFAQSFTSDGGTDIFVARLCTE